MVVVNYKLMINGNVARAEDLYLTSVTAAKRLLSRKIAEIWHMVAIGKWEECAGSWTRKFATEGGATYLVYLSEGYASEQKDQIPPLATGECVDEDSPQLTLFSEGLCRL